MPTTVFTETRFWMLVIFSLMLPAASYGLLHWKRAISRRVMFFFGLALVAIACLDLYLLQSLAALAKLTPSVADDAVFNSELSLALYFLPVMFGGVGVNIVSHVLMLHMAEAERHADHEHP